MRNLNIPILRHHPPLILCFFSFFILILFSFSYVYFFQYHPPILMYHSISPSEPGRSLLVVQPTQFEKQMEYLLNHHYRVIPVEDIVHSIRVHESIPQKSVAITFDDGFEDNYIYAFPILNKHNFPATIFLVTSWIGKKGYLSWSQIKDMESHHISFGNHTVDHPYLPSLSPQDAKREITSAKIILESHLNHASPIFCYPYGATTHSLQSFLQESGYWGAVSTSIDGQSPLDDLYALRRIRISDSQAATAMNFGFKVSGYYGFLRQMQKKTSIKRARAREQGIEKSKK